jgi:hypothetical protein
VHPVGETYATGRSAALDFDENYVAVLAAVRRAIARLLFLLKDASVAVPEALRGRAAALFTSSEVSRVPPNDEYIDIGLSLGERRLSEGACA